MIDCSNHWSRIALASQHSIFNLLSRSPCYPSRSTTIDRLPNFHYTRPSNYGLEEFKEFRIYSGREISLFTSLVRIFLRSFLFPLRSLIEKRGPRAGKRIECRSNPYSFGFHEENGRASIKFPCREVRASLSKSRFLPRDATRIHYRI